MRIVILACAGLVCTTLYTPQLAAQHLDRHGDHFDVHRNVPHGHDSAGHLVDSFGHHIDGHGRHTGAYGIFEDGSHGSPWQGHRPSTGYYPSFGLQLLQSYASPYYNAPYYNPPYLGGQIYSAPYGNSSVYYSQRYTQRIPTILGNSSVIVPQSTPATSAVVANRVPVTNTGPVAGQPTGQLGPEIRLENPRNSGGSVNYSLNEFSYTINPGETQKIPADRQWTLRFDNGLGNTISVSLSAGTKYDFVVSQQNGWQVAAVD